MQIIKRNGTTESYDREKIAVSGVAFYVKTNGASFYHAGDLNNWKWDGAGELVNGIMDVNYKNQRCV